MDRNNNITFNNLNFLLFLSSLLFLCSITRSQWSRNLSDNRNSLSANVTIQFSGREDAFYPFSHFWQQIIQLSTSKSGSIELGSILNKRGIIVDKYNNIYFLGFRSNSTMDNDESSGDYIMVVSYSRFGEKRWEHVLQRQTPTRHPKRIADGQKSFVDASITLLQVPSRDFSTVNAQKEQPATKHNEANLFADYIAVSTNQNLMVLLNPDTGDIVSSLTTKSISYTYASSIVHSCNSTTPQTSSPGNLYFGCGTSVCGVTLSPSPDNMTVTFQQQVSNDYFFDGSFALEDSNTALRNIVAVSRKTNFTSPKLSQIQGFAVIRKTALTESIELEWSQFFDGILGVPVISDKKIFVVEDYTVLHCLLANGSKKWDVDLDIGKVDPHVIVDSHFVYVLAASGEMRAFSTDDGSLQWKALIADEAALDLPLVYSTPSLLNSQTLVVAAVDPMIKQYTLFTIGTDGTNLKKHYSSDIFIPPTVAQKFRTKEDINLTVSSVGPTSIGVNGAMFLPIEFYIYDPTGNITRWLAVNSVVPVYLSSITPKYFFEDEKALEITIEGKGFRQKADSSVHCVVSDSLEEDAHRFEIQAEFATDTLVKCHLEDLPETLKVPAVNYYVQVLILPKDSVQLSNALISNYVQYKLMAVPAIDTLLPFGAPVATDFDKVTIQVNGRNFDTIPGTSAACMFRSSKDTAIVVLGQVVSQNTLTCKGPSPQWSGISGSYQELEFSVSINYDASSQTGRFFSSDDTFYIYPLPTVSSFYPKILPLNGGSTFAFRIQSTILDLFLLKESNSLKCSFGEKQELQSPVTCLRNVTIPKEVSEPEAVCNCPIPTNVKEIQAGTPVPFAVSYNAGVNFNTTSTVPKLLFYTQPVIYGLVPDRGNITGGTIVKVTGQGFFDSSIFGVFPLCKFGSMPPVRAMYSSEQELFCTSPSILRGERGGPLGDIQDYLTVDVRIAQNGFDYTPTNSSFTYALFHRCPGDPDECSRNGQCNHLKGICICEKDWKGPACTIKIKQGYWIPILLGLLGLTVLMFFIIIVLLLFFGHKSTAYKRLLEERSKNDITTTL